MPIEKDEKPEIMDSYIVKANDRIFGYSAGTSIHLTKKQAKRYLKKGLIQLSIEQQKVQDEEDAKANKIQAALEAGDHDAAAAIERGEDGKFKAKK